MSELAYIEISKLRTQIDVFKRKIKELTPQAVRELRKEGLTYDSIIKIMQIGKVTAMAIIKGGEKKERKCPKCDSLLLWDVVMRHYKCSICSYIETGSFQT